MAMSALLAYVAAATAAGGGPMRGRGCTGPLRGCCWPRAGCSAVAGAGTVCSRGWLSAFQPECELWTQAGGLAGVGQQPERHGLVAHDREPPVVKGDQLGQRFGAQPPAIAGNEVDSETGGPAGSGGHLFLPCG